MLTSDGEGRDRRSKTVKGTLFLVNREARVKPAGPAPIIAILGVENEDILIVVALNACDIEGLIECL